MSPLQTLFGLIAGVALALLCDKLDERFYPARPWLWSGMAVVTFIIFLKTLS